MPISVNVNGSWIDIKTPFVYHNGSWRTIIRQGVNDNGSWRAIVGDSGRIFAWGEFVGDGTTNYYSTPIYLTGSGINWNKISSHISPEYGFYLDRQIASTSSSNASNVPTRVTAGIKADGTLWVWGKDEIGRFGTGEQIYQSPTIFYRDHGYNSPYQGLQTEYLTPVPTIYGEDSWKDVSVGRHACSAIKTDGTMWVWGSNLHGQLSLITSPHNSTRTVSFSTPKSVHSSYGTDWKQVSVGDIMSAAIDAQGRLFWWGGKYVDSWEGQLGTQAGSAEDYQVSIPTMYSGSRDSLSGHTGAIGYPTSVFGTSDWVKVSCGRNHTGAVKTDGTLWMWGINSHGQCGTINTNLTTFQATRINNWCVSIPSSVGGTDWEDVHCGNEFTIAKKTNGTVWTWGKVDDDRLGRLDGNLKYGYPDNSSTPVPVIENYASRPMKLYGHPTGWKSSSTTDPDDFDTFTIGGIDQFGVEVNSAWNGISSGKRISLTTLKSSHYKKTKNSCLAIKTDGTLWAWGSNMTSQLGIDVFYSGNPVVGVQDMDVHTPVPVHGEGTDWKSIHTGTGFSCGLKTDGTMWMWGYNNLTSSTLLAEDLTYSGVYKIYYDYASDIRTFSSFSRTPRLVPGNNWKQVCIGPFISAAVKTDGTLWWFGKTNGASMLEWPGNHLQDGEYWTTFASPIPIRVSDNNSWSVRSSLNDGTNSTVISHGWYATPDIDGDYPKDVGGGMALKTDGTLWWWGQLKSPVIWGGPGAHGYFLPRLSTPYSFGTGWKCIYGSNYNYKDGGFNLSHYMGIKTDGTMWLWGGRNNGYLDFLTGAGFDADYPIPPTPVEVGIGGNNWKCGALAAPTSASTLNGAICYGIKTDGTLWAWGIAKNLGLGPISWGAQNTIWNYSGSFRGYPRQVPGGDWKKVVVGQDSSAYQCTVALKNDGTVWTWGSQFAEYGFSSTTFYTPVPAAVSGCKDISISRNGRVIFALGTNGNLYRWGEDPDLQGKASSYSYGRKRPTWSNPTQIPGSWKHVCAGFYHNFGIKTDGTLWSWGRFSNVQRYQEDSITNGWNILPTSGIKWSKPLWDLAFSPWTPLPGGPGSGLQNSDYLRYPINITDPVLVDDSTDWEETYQSESHEPQNYGLKTDGSMWIWGMAWQNGYPATQGSFAPTVHQDSLAWTPVCVGLGKEPVWKQISVGLNIAAAIKTDGTLWTVDLLTETPDSYGIGKSDYIPALGRGVVGAPDFVEYSDTLLYVSNSIYRWGEVKNGGNNWKQVACAWYNTAAIKTDGTLWEWGNNKYGVRQWSNLQIAFPFTYPGEPDYYSPKEVGGTDWKQISAGAFHFGAVKTDGTLWVWGDNASGQLGINNIGGQAFAPTPVHGGYNDWLHVKCSENMTMAMRGDGTNNTIYVWGGRGTFPTYSRGYLRARYTLNGVAVPDLAHPDIPDINSALAQNAVTYNLIGEIPGSWDRIASTNSRIHDKQGTSSTESGGMATKRDGTLWVWGKSVGTSISSYTPTGIVSQNNYSWTVIGNGCVIQRAIV